MNVKARMHRQWQSELNRINWSLNNDKLGPAQYSKLNRRRSEILRLAEWSKVKLKAV